MLMRRDMNGERAVCRDDRRRSVRDERDFGGSITERNHIRVSFATVVCSLFETAPMGGAQTVRRFGVTRNTRVWPGR
jgi:hypothetical protein